MPHLTLEYSANLEGFATPAFLRTLNEALMTTGEFKEADIKSRAVRVDVFAVGTQEAPRGFISARLSILSGRTPEMKLKMSQLLLEAIKPALREDWQSVQVSVDVADMNRDAYSKYFHNV